MLSLAELERIVAAHAPVLPRRPPRLSGAQLCAGLVYHHLQPRGTLAEHLEALTGEHLSDSAASQRRLKMPREIFETILEVALVPLAERTRQPEAFYAGLRLVGIDGTQFSLQNTPTILGAMTKAASRRLGSAFAKLAVAVLVELGTHAPLAAAIAGPGELPSEAELAAQVLCRLPEKSLLLGDRLYGSGAFIARLLVGSPAGHEQAFLLRVSRQPKPKTLRRLADGSRLVEVRLARAEADLLGAESVMVREVRGRVQRPGGAWSEVRLWTSLLDEKAHPARTLLGLYARRWEQELAYHELKVSLRASGDVPLAGHTPETAAQEVAALLVGVAMVARARLQSAADAGMAATPLRVSFGRTLATLQPLWLVLNAGADLLSSEQQRLLTERVLGPLSRRLLPAKRRARTCPRAVRQPVGSWPRLTQTHQQKGNWLYEVDDLPN